MIIARAPHRISLFGGSTDYESYYSEYGSLLLGFTINSYCYINTRYIPKVLDDRLIITYSKIERPDSISDIQHNGIRGVLQALCLTDNVEVNITADLPARTGTGSSSSCIVAALLALTTLRHEKLSRYELARRAIYIERVLLNEPGGIQDQIWAAYGGFNSIEIGIDGKFAVKPLPISDSFKEEFRKSLILFYTGKQRDSFGIAAAHNVINDNKHDIRSTAERAYESFAKHNIPEIGVWLNSTWYAKRGICAAISNERIDQIYEYGKECGAYGGKLLGSGCSGFMVFMVDADKRDSFINAMEVTGLQHIEYDYDTEGAKVILNA